MTLWHLKLGIFESKAAIQPNRASSSHLYGLALCAELRRGNLRLGRAPLCFPKVMHIMTRGVEHPTTGGSASAVTKLP